MSGRVIASTAKHLSKQSFVINGVEMQPRKPLVLALRKFWGIGSFQARRICFEIGLNPLTAVYQTALPEINRFEALKKHVEEHYSGKLDGQRTLGLHIINKIKMGSYQGMRHTQSLPVNGQNTRNNAKSQRKMGQRRIDRYGLPQFKRQSGGSQKPEVVAERLRLAAKAAAEAAAAATAAKQAKLGIAPTTPGAAGAGASQATGAAAAKKKK